MAGFFGVGVFFSWSSKNFPNQVAMTVLPRTARDPAAINRVFDFSNLGGSALALAAKQRILDGFKVVREPDVLGLELGHFVFRGSDGEKRFACQNYSKVIMSFEGEGIATGGERPEMEVEGRCEISSDINSIAAIWIPVAKILGEPVADGEFDFRDERSSKLKFTNVSDQWPRQWQLKSVKLMDPSGAQGEVSIPTSELRQMVQKPVLIVF
jgi:hypothetical protein